MTMDDHDSAPAPTLSLEVARRARPFTRGVVLLLVAALGLAATLGLVAAAGWAYYHPRFEWRRGITYGRRGDVPLVFDVLEPLRPNGLGIVFVVSGGWKSSPDSFQPWLVAPLLRRGYTVLPVYHVPQPAATVMEIVADVERAVRFIRSRAAELGIDPDRIGVTGGSAGGHLALMLATRGGPGAADALDPIDRESSGVQAVAIFYPVTDLTDLSGSTEDPGDGGPPLHFRPAFAQEPVDMAAWRDVSRALSPLHHVRADLPPILIHHGTADTLVPIGQSQRFRDAARTAGSRVELVEVPGGGHGWAALPLSIPRCAAWFDEHLRP